MHLKKQQLELDMEKQTCSNRKRSMLRPYISENVGLKLNIQKSKMMASGPITSWQIHGETMETVRNFIFLGSKITADGDCSHEIQRPCSLKEKL